MNEHERERNLGGMVALLKAGLPGEVLASGTAIARKVYGGGGGASYLIAVGAGTTTILVPADFITLKLIMREWLKAGAALSFKPLAAGQDQENPS